MSIHKRTFRFYRNEFPEVDEIVMTRVTRKIDNLGYAVELLEYANIEGIAQLSEVTRGGRHKSPNPLKIGQVLPMIVLRVDPNTKEIDLSKRKVPKEEVESFEKLYQSYGRMNNLGMELYELFERFCSQTGEKMDDGIEFVMNASIWNLFEKDDDCDLDEIWSQTLENPRTIMKSRSFPARFEDLYADNITSRRVITNALFELDFSVQTYAENGVDLIKELLSVDLNQELPEKYTVSISILSPPHYKIRIEGTDLDKCQEIYEKSVHTLKEKAKTLDLTLNISGPLQRLRNKSVDLHFLSQFDLDKIDFSD